MMKIIQNQKSEYKIFLPAEATIVEQTAAEELRQYLEKSYGVTLAVESEKKVEGKAFYVGHTVYAKEAGVFGDSKENWVIKVKDGNIILTGGVTNQDRGIVYAVYHFLEDIVGIRWWSRWEEYVPKQTELSLEADFCKSGTPAFPYRKILSHMYSHSATSDFFTEARNRQNVLMADDQLPGGINHESVKRLGGAMHMGRPGHVHTLNQYFPADPYFELHPEWFAWSDGEGRRVPYSHYCLTNEEFYEAILKQLLAYIEEDYRIAEETGMEPPCFYSISFPDSSEGFCQCEHCKKIVEKSGASGYALHFVNKVARAVAEKYPNVNIETLVYSLYLDPPTDDTIPEKNVVIRLAQVYVDIIHGIHEKGNEWYLRLLKAWSAICKKAGCKLYIWDYMYNLFLELPLPIAYRLCDTFRAFYEYGVSGIFVENENATVELWELNHYMMTRLTEDPYLDETALIEDFMAKFFDPAAEYVKGYLEEIGKASKANPYSVFCIIESVHFNYLDAATVSRCYELLRKAEAVAVGDAELTFKIRWIQKVIFETILVKYFDLKHMAERLGQNFEYDREALRKEILEILELSVKHPRLKEYSKTITKERDYFAALEIGEEEFADIPEELSDVNPKDVYQFHFKNSCRHIRDAQNYGVSIVEDPESSLGKTAKMCREDALYPGKMVVLYTTSKYAEHQHPISISMEQDAKITEELKLYREDIKQGGYHLYKVGSAAGIRKSGDTRVNIFGNNFEWISLTGISVVFPMDACDVYLSMKFTGALYGGSEQDQDAVFVDRVIVVRKESNI